MGFAETVYRLGSALAGFLIGYAHCLILAVLPHARAATGANDPWLASSVFAAFSAVAFLLLPLGQPFRAPLRWLTVPFLLLIPLAAFTVASIALNDYGPRFWVPVQLALLIGLAWRAFGYWRAASTLLPSTGPPGTQNL